MALCLRCADFPAQPGGGGRLGLEDSGRTPRRLGSLVRMAENG
jgi:hypothetical protein